MTRSGLRVLVFVLLLATMLGQLVWFGAHPPVRAEPSTSTIYANYGDYVGQRVVVSGTVVETNPVVIALEGVPDARLTVTGVQKQVRTGDRLQVYGCPVSSI